MNIKLAYNLVKGYLFGLSEWFWSYLVATNLLILTILVLFLYIIFGVSILFNIVYGLLKMLIGVHAYLSFIAILHDYIYNRYIVTICSKLLLILVISVVCDSLVL